MGEGSASRPVRSLPPGKSRYPLYRSLGGLQGRSGQVRKNSPPPGFDPRTVQPVASRYTDHAARPIYIYITLHIIYIILCYWNIYLCCSIFVFYPPEILSHMEHNTIALKKNDGDIINVFIHCKPWVTFWILTTIGTGGQKWYFTKSCPVGYALFVRTKGWTDGHGVTWRDKTWLFVTSLPTRLLKITEVLTVNKHQSVRLYVTVDRTRIQAWPLQ